MHYDVIFRTVQLDVKSQTNTNTTVVVAAFVVLLVALATVVIITAVIIYKKKHSDKGHMREDIPEHVYDTISSPAMSAHDEPTSPDQITKEITCQAEQEPDDTVKYDDLTSVQKAVENPIEIELEMNEAYNSLKPYSDHETTL